VEKRYPIPAIPVNTRRSFSLKSLLRDLFVVTKLNNPAGYLLLLLLAAGIGVAVAKGGMIAGILPVAALVGVAGIYMVVAFPKIGVVIFLTAAYFLLLVIRIGVGFPLGTLMDGMEALFLLGLFLQQKIKPEWHLFKGSVSRLMLIWIVYNLLEFANPAAASRVAWVFTVRTVALVMVMYFIFMYHIRTKKFVKFILKLWLVLAFIGATYAYKQEHFGFFPFEERYLHSDPNVELLLFIGGTWRKFSIFSDPVVYAYTMSFSSLLCIGLLTGPLPLKKKLVLYFLIFWYSLNMLYSGTRGAFVLVPAGMILYTILKFNKGMIIPICIAIVALIVIINMPTNNQIIYRFQTAFKPDNDPSYIVRKINQKRIQPFILSHPMGGGLGSTGEWGQKFSPGTYLASFPPDSGYVRVAVENGWLGLFILCSLMFTILKTGINNYFKIKDPELKSYALAMVLVIFAFHIANFPQEALVQYPSNVYFYLVIALINILLRIDNEQNEQQHAAERQPIG
jgi:putative inorganic carbon (hco3(-)) transporter